MVDVAGAALGAPFGLALQELYVLLKDVVRKARMFKSLLKRLEFKLETMIAWVERIRELTGELDKKAKEISSFNEQNNERKELLRKCSEIRKWNLYRKYTYTSKLTKLEADLQGFIEFFLPLFKTTVVLENQLYLKNIQAGMYSIHSMHQSLNLGVRNGWLSFPVPPSPPFIVGLDEHMKKLKGMLLNKEVSVLALTASGGCGKTTLVTMLCQDEEIKGVFKENIFFICVSKYPNLKDIVDKLFDNKGRQVHTSGRVEDEIDQLGEQLNQIEDPILLILDDVQSDSEYLLEKFQLDMPNYKILLTSRSVSPKFHSTYKLKPLKDKDAMDLFRHSASPQSGSLSISDKDMKKILKFCGGFPLALIVAGRSLYGKPPEACRSLLKKQSSGLSSLGSNRDLLDCLQKSLDILDDEITKKCFQDLGLFPEDQRIPVSALIDMWSDLYDLDEDGNDAITKLDEISNRHLASLVLMRKAESDVGKYYNEDFVLQHDLLRELAIHQSYCKQIEQQERLIVDISENNHPKWWSEQNPLSIKAHILSIISGVNFSSSCCNIHPFEVKVLLLHFQTESYTLPELVTKMNKLKVLIITNYGFSCAKFSSFQLLKFTPCLRKIRLEKVSIPSFCDASESLTCLEKVSLIMCNIQQAFTNCTIKISDALPKLREINIDYCNDLVELPDELFEIASLKKLSVTNCHNLSNMSQKVGELTNLEVLRLRSCTDLWQLPESIRSLYKLSILDISDCLNIIKLPKYIGELHSLKELHMEGCMKIRSELPSSILDLEQLELVTCNEVAARMWEPIKEILTELQVKVVAKDVNLNWLFNPDI